MNELIVSPYNLEALTSASESPIQEIKQNLESLEGVSVAAIRASLSSILSNLSTYDEANLSNLSISIQPSTSSPPPSPTSVASEDGAQLDFTPLVELVNVFGADSTSFESPQETALKEIAEINFSRGYRETNLFTSTQSILSASLGADGGELNRQTSSSTLAAQASGIISLHLELILGEIGDQLSTKITQGKISERDAVSLMQGLMAPTLQQAANIANEEIRSAVSEIIESAIENRNLESLLRGASLVDFDAVPLENNQENVNNETGVHNQGNY